MKYKNIEGIDISWWPKNRPRGNSSKNHAAALEIIQEKYPGAIIYEEVNLPIEKKNLYLDFLVPDFRIAFEVDGRQHDEFVAHFHGNAMGFVKQQRNDRLKEEWCEINKIQLVRLKERERKSWSKKF